MTDVQCREERGRKQSLYNTPPLPILPPFTTSYIAFTGQIAPQVDACCWLASGFALRLSPRCTSVIPDLILLSWIILSFTSSQSPNSHVQLIHSAPQLNWRRAPPSFLAASLPLLELLIHVSQWAMVRQRCLLFKQKSTSDQNDVGTALLLAMFYVSKIDA